MHTRAEKKNAPENAAIRYELNPRRVIAVRDPMIYGHFLEHFHRQIYGGIYQPGHPLSDEDGFRTDVLEALRKIRVPIIRWPGGCFVSSYHWYKGVGEKRTPVFDISWRVEDDNSFGTDEFVKFCRKLHCEPYICTNAGTGNEEEMANWMEYCNLDHEGEYARMRIANGHPEPYNIRYWSIGNENWGGHEIGAKGAAEWGRLVLEASKMMQHVDPTAQLSAAALVDIDWNVNLLKNAGSRLDWISIHGYWDGLWQEDRPADYEACMAFTEHLDADVKKVRGLLMTFGLEEQIRIAYDEWNLRGWHHPNIHTLTPGVTKEEYLYPRDRNDINATYTMADAVFSACFLNMVLRNADIVGMANFAPAVNTRGAIYTHDKGIVLRTTYHVFDLYTNRLGDEVIEMQNPDSETFTVLSKAHREVTVDVLDVVATRFSQSGKIAVSAVNKHPEHPLEITLTVPAEGKTIHVISLTGRDKDDYNDIDRNDAVPFENDGAICRQDLQSVSLLLPPHSVNIIEIG